MGSWEGECFCSFVQGGEYINEREVVVSVMSGLMRMPHCGFAVYICLERA